MNSKLTILDIVDSVAEKSGLTKKETEQFVKEFFLLASEVISKGETLTIKGVGTFAPVWVDARTSVDVNTKESIEIPGHYKLSFTPDKSMKDAVNAPFAAFTTEIVDVEQEIEVKAIAEEEVSEPVSDVSVTEIIETEQQSEKEEPIEEEDVVEQTIQPVEQPKQEEDVIAVTKPQTPQYSEWELEEEYRRRTRNGYIGGFITAIVIFLLLLLFLWWLFNRRGSDFSISFASFKLVAGNEQVIMGEDGQQVVDSVENKVDSLVVSVEESKAPIHIKEPVTTTIRRGRFLTTIANEYYGNKIFWVYIYRENQSRIWNPRDLPAGFKVVVPDASKYDIDASDPESIKRAKELERQILYEIE
ncbi:MAG: HU family DNA-binding protein [Bacteroidales bacterium]|nr:HU family DNA-binding protein [Bacteroidales bacterium]